MTDMIERVARAIAWQADENEDWVVWLEEARAAIAAMRDPTEEMVSLMAAADIGALGGFASMREIWAAGIDAALGGST